MVSPNILKPEHAYTRYPINTQHFTLIAFLAPVIHSDTLSIYIEGDGLAWLTRTQASPNPTPTNPVALKLALLNKQGNVAYLARPCQYTNAAEAYNCNPHYWTDGRFAPEVITSMDQAIEALKQKTQARTIRLIGFSGGGSVAALVAARRNDVSYLVTLAGNLDHTAWTQHHGVSPLSDSINPVNIAADLRNTRQIHFSGSLDKVIPHSTTAHYRSVFTHSDSARFIVIPNTRHNCCWSAVWPELQHYIDTP